MDFLEGFLRWISSKEHHAPLDFFDWHYYNSCGIREMEAYAQYDWRSFQVPKELERYAAYGRETLDRYGFATTETLLDEWNLHILLRGTAKHAALVGCVLCTLQNLPVDKAMFYDARIGTSRYGSLFNPLTWGTLPAYDAFVMFGRLLSLGGQMEAVIRDGEGLFTMAASDGDRRGLMIANILNEEAKARLIVDGEEMKGARVQITADGRRLAEGELAQSEITLPPSSLTWIEWHK